MDIATLGIGVDTSDLSKGEMALKGFSNQGVRTERAVIQSAARMEDSLEDVSVAARRLNRGFDLRGLTMQLSQVSDMALATGDPIRALAIQASDIGMIMGGPVAIGLGIASGVALQLGSSLLGIGGGAKDAGQAVEELADALANYSDFVSLAQQPTRQLREEFGQFADDVRGFARFAAEVEIGNIRDKVGEFALDLSSVTRSIETDLVLLNSLQMQLEQARGSNGVTDTIQADIDFITMGAEEAAKSLGLTVDQALRLNDAMNAFNGATELEDMTTAAGALLNEMQSLVSTGADLPPELREAYFEVQTLYNRLATATQAQETLNDSASETSGHLHSGARAAGSLAGQLAQASGMAAQLVSILGQVPAAVASIGNQVDAAVNALERQNRSLSYQLQQGLSASAASIKAQRDEALRTAAAAGATIDELAEVGEAFDAQAAKAETLATENRNMNETLAEQAKALREVGGGGGGGGGASGAAAKGIEDYTEVLRAAEDILEDFNREQERMTELATDWISAISEGAIDGDLRGAFSRLGEQSRDAFYTALGSGQGIGQIFASGISGVGAGLAQGGLAGIGSAISAAMPAIGAISAVAGLISSFSSSQVIGQGVRGRIGDGSVARDYETTRRTSFWGLLSSTSTEVERNDELTGVLRQSATAVRSEVDELARGIGGTARDLAGVRSKFDIDTAGMSPEEVERALTAEVQAYQEKVAQAALGTDAFTRAGESAIDTLGRLTANLQTYNDVQRVLGLETLPKSIENAAMAGNLLERAGGAEGAAAGAATVFGFMDEGRQRELLRGQFVQQGGQRGIMTRDDFVERYEGLLADGQVGKAADLLGAAPIFDELMRLRDALDESADAAERAAGAERLRIDERRLGQREALTRELLRAEGDEDELRRRIISQDTYGKINRQIQRQIWAIEDETQARREQEALLRDLDGEYFANFYSERRARLDVMNGRDWRLDYGTPSFGGTPSGNSQSRIIELLEMVASASMLTSKATQQTQKDTRVLVAQGG